MWPFTASRTAYTNARRVGSGGQAGSAVALVSTVPRRVSHSASSAKKRSARALRVGVGELAGGDVAGERDEVVHGAGVRARLGQGGADVRHRAELGRERDAREEQARLDARAARHRLGPVHRRGLSAGRRTVPANGRPAPESPPPG